MLDLLPFGRDQVIRVALVVALLAGVTAAAFGIGYRSSDAVLGDGSAYVQKGHTVAHVNAESGKTDAEAARDLATGRQRLEVVQVRPGEVYVVNNETGEVWRLPTDTLQPGRVEGVESGASPDGGAGNDTAQAPGQPEDKNAPKARSELVSGGGAGYLFDAESGKLSRLEGQRAVQVALPARADAVVVDNSGTAWALSKADGVLYEVSGTGVRGSRTVAIPNEAARLTLVADHPVVFLPERGSGGVIRVIGSDGPAELVVGQQPDGALQIARPSSGPPVFAVLQQRDDTLMTVDLTSGEERQLHLEGRSGPRSYGNPVIARDHVYLPDFNRRQVIVVQLKPLRQLRSVSVPGREPSFEVFERDGRVWVNDPYARTLLTFNGDKWTEPDKGDGRGTDNPDNQPPTKPPNPPGSPTKAPGRPSPSPSPPRRVAVPQVAGLSGDEACNKITTAELTCPPPVTKQQAGCKTGNALETNPAAGSLVAVRTQVAVFVCGPTAMPGPLLGMQIDQACRVVELAELVCAKRDGGPAQNPSLVGTVSGQNPQPTAQLPKGSTVEVAYFTGVTVPQITGMGPAQACATLQAQRLVCAPNPEEITWEANVVHAQSIPPGTAAALDTPVGYAYQDTGPNVLLRWKVNSQDVRALSLGGPPTVPTGLGWTQQSSIGGAYPPAGGVPGLVPIYQHRCVSGCGSGRWTTGFHYSQDPAPPNNRWVTDGVAFSCFGQQYPGTVKLVGMFNSTVVAWAFAPEGSGEYNNFVANGYAPGLFICFVWYGLPGLP